MANQNEPTIQAEMAPKDEASQNQEKPVQSELLNNLLKAEVKFTDYQRAAAQIILAKLREITNSANKDQLELNLLMQEINQLRDSLKILFDGRDVIGTKDEILLLVKLFSEHWQTQDEKLAEGILSPDFLSEYIYKLSPELQYSFTQISSALLQIKDNEHIQLLASLSELLKNLHDKNKITYQNGEFELKETGKGIGRLKGISSESIAAFNKITTTIEKALKRGITLIEDKPIIELLDTYISSTAGKNLLTANPELRGKIKAVEKLYQLTVINTFDEQQRELFLAIKREDLLDHKNYRREGNAINAYIDNFNQIAAYVRQDITHEENIDKRTIKTERWIEIMRLCEKQGNFHALNAISSAIDASEINRLKITFEGVSEEAKEYLTYLATLKEHNYKHLRAMHAPEAMNRAPIPDLSIVIKDIIISAESADKDRFAQAPGVIKSLALFDSLKDRLKGERVQYTIPPDTAFAKIIKKQTTDKDFDKQLYAVSLRIEPRNAKLAPSNMQAILASKKIDKPLGFFSKMATIVQAVVRRDWQSAKSHSADLFTAAPKVTAPEAMSITQIPVQLSAAEQQAQKEQELKRHFLQDIVAQTQVFKPEGMTLTASQEVTLEEIFGPEDSPQKLPQWLTEGELKIQLPQIFMAMIQADAKLALRLTANPQIMEILYHDEVGRHYLENQLSYEMLEPRCWLTPAQLIETQLGSTFNIGLPGGPERIMNIILNNVKSNLPQLSPAAVKISDLAEEGPRPSRSASSSS